MVHYNSSKQKMNTKSSTGAKIVSVSDYLPYNIFICLFMETQGCDIKQNIIFQYNHIIIIMDKNGNISCTSNSCHINMYYLFVKDRGDTKNMLITYFSTEQILADFLAKSVQGSLFVKFCEVIMIWKQIYTLQMVPPSTN